MAILIEFMCLLLFVSMARSSVLPPDSGQYSSSNIGQNFPYGPSQNFPYGFGQHFPSNFSHNLSSIFYQNYSLNNVSSLSTSFMSMMNNISKTMATMFQNLQLPFNGYRFPTDYMDSWMEDRKQLDAIKPNCTTKTNTPSTQNNRRKQFRTTQTTTCVKELILNGKKHLYKEVNITDENGILISRSKFHEAIMISTPNNTMSTSANKETGVITY